MTLRIAFTLLLINFTFFVKAQEYSREGLYQALAGKNIEAIDGQYNAISAISSNTVDGFKGALLMKKAGLIPNVKEKLALFKKGHKILEEAINKDDTNAELKFLRLMIQENAPDILKYNKELEKDGTFIRQSFQSLPHDLKKTIIDYSRSSKVLKPSDFEK